MKSRFLQLQPLKAGFLVLATLLLTTLGNSLFAQASSGPNNPSSNSTSQYSGGFNRSWTNPGNVYTSNNVRASVDLGTGPQSQYSHWLDLTGFGFSIPTGAIIIGFTVDVEGYASGSGVSVNQVQLRRAGNRVGNAENGSNLPNNNSGTEAYQSLGDNTNLWGTTWTPAQVNASTFGVSVVLRNTNGSDRTGYIDHVRVTVHYIENPVSLFMWNTNESQTGTGTYVRALMETQGVCGSSLSEATNSTIFAERLAFTRDYDNFSTGIADNYFEVSVNISAESDNDVESRFRIQRLNSSGSVLASTGYSSTWTNTGVKTAVLSFASAQTWQSGDRLRLSIEVRRDNSGMGTRTITVGTCDANSYIIYGGVVCTDGTLSADNPGDADQTLCAGNDITAIGFTVGGSATGASVSGLPAGLSGSYSAPTYTISGTVDAGLGDGSYTYTVTTTGSSPCAEDTYTGTITVNGKPAITASAVYNVCVNGLPYDLNNLGVTPGGGSFTGTGITADILTSGSIGTTITVVYDVTDGNGCANTASFDIAIVDACPYNVEQGNFYDGPTALQDAWDNALDGETIVIPSGDYGLQTFTSDNSKNVIITWGADRKSVV